MGLALRWPIFWLTLRQFRAGKAVWVTAGFAALPILLAVLYRSGTSTESPNGFLAGLYQNLLGPTILPLGTLILATTALGNEIEDRTLVYLTLKPLARARILIAKYLAALAVGGCSSRSARGRPGWWRRSGGATRRVGGRCWP
jgi:ABC-type transport system involved in multi-copper enzyme maturation permease subunit